MRMTTPDSGSQVMLKDSMEEDSMRQSLGIFDSKNYSESLAFIWAVSFFKGLLGRPPSVMVLPEDDLLPPGIPHQPS